MIRALLIKTLVNGLALWLAAIVVPGISLGDDTKGWAQKLGTVVLVALVFGIVNAVVKPIVKFFSIPFIWLTLGLFTIVINALMLMLTSWLADSLSLAFHVDHFFWSGVLGAIVVSFVAMVLNAILPDEQPERRVTA